MKILIFATSYNGLTQRIHRELLLSKHTVSFELSADEQDMLDAYINFEPDLIICPFLKHRIPQSVWSKIPCLVLHPGIIGDKGPSSLDWAITNNSNIWGATLLQANDVYDAGEVWGTKYFSVDENACKSSVYRHSINHVAVSLIMEAVSNFKNNRRPLLNFDDFPITGIERPLMKQSERKLDWQNESAATIVRKINAADSFPGVLDQIENESFYLFGALKEDKEHQSQPGEIIGCRDEAICRAAKDGVVWIKQLKRKTQQNQSENFKLPATRLLKHQFSKVESDVLNNIKVEIKGAVAYLHFNFYNGAFSTENCRELHVAFKNLTRNADIKVITLMGGSDFFSNGIHLNCIEAADCSAKESWLNINAINDLVECIIRCNNKLTVAALQNNAGAGGAILPLACDYVIARNGVVLNPHYKTMGLTGSEYWTYLLPKRVGQTKAKLLTEECLPLVASEAEAINLVDTVFPENKEDYLNELRQYCRELSNSEDYESLLISKSQLRVEEESKTPLQSYRDKELAEMKKIFDNPDSRYHRLRANFVRKVSCGKTPDRLIHSQVKNKASID
ncbi:hydrogenase maturation protein [Aliikangiella coralliicola]|uniref:Sensor protein hoxX n=1 Tax=Aliikangiella coralliicola TaxID=2592383 RepID=A0A545UJF7_9GAMM|nr:hydrogenase maturation protein [Aliikangiella coralliicola]TQV89598.1 sensor protein hoxX [Aliikangiella coralliicola]